MYHMKNDHAIFDRNRLRLHRNRARLADAGFLLAEMAERLADRLSDIKRTFPIALDLGAHGGELAAILKGRGGIETLVQSDISAVQMAQAKNIRVVCDEELLPFADDSFDLVLSVGSLHWVNDLPGTLIQIRRALKPGGLFMAMLPGGETLKELRVSFEAAEQEISGGISPRISPFVDVRDAGSLLQRAGFAEPVTDSEMITVAYEHPLKLVKDLRTMGESNAMAASKKGFMPCSLMMTAMDYYLRHFMNDDERVTASFELVTLTGWKSD